MHQTEASDGDEMVWFPYFVKQASYSHENEVRFAFREDEPRRKGCSVKTEVSDLIKEIIISPYCIDAEATSVMKVIRGLLPDDSIEVAISGERSNEPWPRQDSTFEERFEHALSPRFIDDSVPDPMRLFPTERLARLAIASGAS